MISRYKEQWIKDVARNSSLYRPHMTYEKAEVYVDTFWSQLHSNLIEFYYRTIDDKDVDKFLHAMQVAYDGGGEAMCHCEDQMWGFYEWLEDELKRRPKYPNREK